MLLLLILIPILLASAFVAEAGKKRTCGYNRAFWCSFFLTPLVGVIYVFSCEFLSEIEFRRQMLECVSLQKLSDAAALHDKGIISDDEMEDIRNSYLHHLNKGLGKTKQKAKPINPVGNILRI